MGKTDIPKLYIREDIDSQTHFSKGLRFGNGGALKRLAASTKDGSVTAIAFGLVDKLPVVIAVADGYLYVVTKRGLFSTDLVELWIPRITAVTWTDGPLFGTAHVVASGVDLLLEKVYGLHKIRTAVNAMTEA